MNQHSFNIKVAVQFGVNCAVLLQNIYYWVEKNKANNKHFHDGYYWTYNSNKAFQQQFEYMTTKQIRYALETLQNEGLILTGNFNEGCDRTLWYTITEKGMNILSGVEDPKPDPIIELEEISEPKSALRRIENKKDDELLGQNWQNDLPKSTNSICPPGQNDLPSVANDTNKKPQIKTTNNIEKEINKEKEVQNSVCLEIFNFWNSKKLLKCEELTQQVKAAILSVLKSFTLEQVKACITRYDEMLNSPDYYFSHSWSLSSFLKQSNAICDFFDNGEKWLSYSRWLTDKKSTNKEKSTNSSFIHNNYTSEQINSAIIKDFSDIKV